MWIGPTAVGLGLVLLCHLCQLVHGCRLNLNASAQGWYFLANRCPSASPVFMTGWHGFGTSTVKMGGLEGMRKAGDIRRDWRLCMPTSMTAMEYLGQSCLKSEGASIDGMGSLMSCL